MPDLVASGKVREIYALDDERLLLVASDRISTFDVVLPTEVPDKGRVLTGLSAFWFTRTSDICPNHLLALRPDGRSTECRRLDMLPLECVVRGTSPGRAGRTTSLTAQCAATRCPRACGSRSARRSRSSPATKATEGHDENIDAAQAIELVGEERFRELEQLSLELYGFASNWAAERGIILADTAGAGSRR